jgi:hypothetical protein
MTFILTVVIFIGSYAITSFTVEYDTQKACENAKQITREGLREGKITLLTCTPKSMP